VTLLGMRYFILVVALLLGPAAVLLLLAAQRLPRHRYSSPESGPTRWGVNLPSRA
jgi:hypothetical protein